MFLHSVAKVVPGSVRTFLPPPVSARIPAESNRPTRDNVNYNNVFAISQIFRLFMFFHKRFVCFCFAIMYNLEYKDVHFDSEEKTV